MRTAYIHIGVEKTGTTTLQNFLLRNDPRLRAVGYTYLPNPHRPYFQEYSHAPIPASFAEACPEYVQPEDHHESAKVLSALSEDAEASGLNLILSAEHLAARIHSPEPMLALRDALGAFDIRVLCYLRRQDLLGASRYATMVRSGRRRPFDPDEVAPADWAYDFSTMLSAWASVFGADKIIVREYTRSALAGGDIRRDALEAIGLPSESFHFGADWNTSPSARQVEALRIVNIHTRAQGAPTADMGLKEARIARRTLLDFLPAGAPLSSLLSPADRQAILNRFRDGNLRIAEVFPGAGFCRAWHRNESPAEEPAHPRPDAPRADLAIGLLQAGDAIARLRQENAALKQRLARPEPKNHTR